MTSREPAPHREDDVGKSQPNSALKVNGVTFPARREQEGLRSGLSPKSKLGSTQCPLRGAHTCTHVLTRTHTRC